MEFKKPEVVKDYLDAIWQSAIALEKVVHGAPVGATENFPQIWTSLKGKLEDSPENMAWTFLANCVSTALMTLLREPRMRCELKDQELTGLAKGLVDALPDDGDIRGTDLINLALAPCTKECIQQASETITLAAPEADFEQSQLEQMYREALARSVTVVFQKQSVLFSGLIESITGPTAEPEMREIAWQRHGAWCRNLFCESPIFSPDNDIDIPLSHVYQKLRCYWNDKHEKECDGDGEPLQYRTATVGNIHETIYTWLNKLTKDDTIRLISGGPGSGKSSFAKAFATELLNKDTHRVLFVQLQGFQTAGTTLREVIGRHLENNYHLRTPHKCEGFPDNPLGWHRQDSRPLLMIFDGLDELTTNKDREIDLTKKFISNLKHLLNELNGEYPSAAAIVLGRDVAMNAALDDGGLSLDNLIHVAPIREMTRDDLQLKKNPPDAKIGEGFNPVIDPRKLIEEDTRKSYWDQWCRVQGTPQSEPPQAIYDERMSDLNVEPLLLHLLIISDFCGDRWEEAANNRNLVYRNIFGKVLKRNKDKDLDAYKNLNEKCFFELMEVFGLAAFRGNGRTGDHKEFKFLRKRYANHKTERDLYSELDGAKLENVALMVHSRQEIAGAGFEFVHKSFGEYLAALALLGAAERLQRFWHNDDNDEDEIQLAERWVNLVGTGELSNPVLRFLRDECHLWDAVLIEKTIKALTAIFDRTLRDGFPVQQAVGLSNTTTYRQMEHRQRCAEKAMLATITSLWLAWNKNSGIDETPLITLPQLETSRAAASKMIDRVWTPTERGVGIPPTLSGLSLKGNDLYGIRIPHAILNRADLSGADLGGADLRRADLYCANLEGADLERANLREADLDWADLSSTNLIGADLSGTQMFSARLILAQMQAANLNEADLCGADLYGADLERAYLEGARLSGANLSRANLNRAVLIGAVLKEVDLNGAYLYGADLYGADLNGARLDSTDLVNCRSEGVSVWSVDLTKNVNLTQEQIDTFFGVKSGFGKTILPEHLSYPDHWYCAESVPEANSVTVFDEYMNAWREWRRPR